MKLLSVWVQKYWFYNNSSTCLVKLPIKRQLKEQLANAIVLPSGEHQMAMLLDKKKKRPKEYIYKKDIL